MEASYPTRQVTRQDELLGQVIWNRVTIVPSKLRNDRFFRRFVSDSFVNYEGHICVPCDHNSLQAACEKLQVSV